MSYVSNSVTKFRNDTITSHPNRDQVMDPVIHLFENLQFAIYALMRMLESFIFVPQMENTTQKAHSKFKYTQNTKQQ